MNYLLFLIQQYEPAGGWDDLSCEFETMEECMKSAEQSRSDMEAQIVFAGKVIKRGRWIYEPSPLTGQDGTWHYQWTDEA